MDVACSGHRAGEALCPWEMMSTSSTNPAIAPTSVGITRGSIYAALLLISLVVLATALTYYGGSFYVMDVQERVDHAQFRELSPSGPVGHGYGIAGTGLILTNLLYLLRRRFARWKLGSMRLWLEIHVFTGLFGSVLILYHSAFQLRSGIASLTAISLFLVVVSGIVGRYFFALNPAAGNKQLHESASALRRMWPELAQHLMQARSELPPPTRLDHPTLVNSLLHLPRWFKEARTRKSAIWTAGSDAIAQHPIPAFQRKALRLRVAALATEVGAEAKGVAGEHLLRTWRGLHRAMAVLMVVSVTVHIGVAWYFGFRWMWSE